MKESTDQQHYTELEDVQMGKVYNRFRFPRLYNMQQAILAKWRMIQNILIQEQLKTGMVTATQGCNACQDQHTGYKTVMTGHEEQWSV